MRIAHVSSAHPWTDNRVHYREAATLSGAGHEVILVATESTVEGPHVGVDIKRIPSLPRSRRIMVSTVRAIAVALKQRADVYHLHDPELVWAIPLLHVLGKKVVYDAHEDLPVQVLSKSYVNGFSRRVLSVFAQLIVRIARTSNHIVAATEKIAVRFPAHKTSVVHNYPPLRAEEENLSGVTEKRAHVVYIGGIGESRGVKVMISALADKNFPTGWRLHLAGTMSASLETSLSQLPGWELVDYRGQVAPERARDLLLEAKVGLLLLQNTQAYVESLPTKMFEYFAAGLPVVASDFPQWRKIIEEHDCGLLVDEKSPAAVAAAVRRYTEDPELLERHSRNARRAAETVFNWTHEARILLAVYDRLTEA